MNRVGVVTEDNTYLEWIASSLEKEKLKVILIRELEDLHLSDLDVLITKNMTYADAFQGNCLLLKETLEGEGIYLYQGKGQLLKQINQSLFNGETSLTMPCVYGIASFQCPEVAFSYSLLWSHLMGLEKKACLLSFNPFIPYRKIFPFVTQGHLSQLYYYLLKKESIPKDFLSYYSAYHFYYLGPSLTPGEENQIEVEIFQRFLDYLDEQKFDYLIWDLFNPFLFLRFKKLLNAMYYVQSQSFKDTGCSYLKTTCGLEGVTPLMSFEEALLIEGLDKIIINERSRGYRFWKEKLKKLF